MRELVKKFIDFIRPHYIHFFVFVAGVIVGGFFVSELFK